MTVPAAQSSTAPPHFFQSPSAEDDETVVTPTRGDKMKSNESMREEKTIKFRFPPSRTKEINVHPVVLHAHWMQEVQNAFGEGVQFFDNNNRQLVNLDPLRINPDTQINNLKVHTSHSPARPAQSDQPATNRNQQQTTHFIVHRIRTQYTLGEIKRAPNVSELMQRYDFYVNEHRWSETDWDTTQLGFIYGLDPQFYDVDQATSKVLAMMQRSVPKLKIPKFRLVQCSPKIQKSRGNRTVRTKAFAFETLRNQKEEFTRVLKQAYKENGEFVPFKMRARHPEAFERFVKAQTNMLSNNFVMILNHLGPDVMHHISERILALDGVQALLPGKTVNDNGRYKILIHQKYYNATRELLTDKLAHWVNQYAASDAKATLAKYPGPPEVANTSSDGFSRGEDSYMTISVNSALSISSAISDSSPPTFVFQRDRDSDTSTLEGSRTYTSSISRTWADTVAGRSTSRTNQDQPLKENNDKILHELATSQAEVELLKIRLARMETERLEQQQSLAEIVQDQVAKAVQAQMETFTAQMTQMFASLVTTLHNTPSPKTKRPVQEEVEDDELTGNDIKTRHFRTENKRQDNKETPKKGHRSQTKGDEKMIQTSNSSTVINNNQIFQWSEGNYNNTRAQSAGEQKRKDTSKSEDVDVIEQDSGNESTNKSLADVMEAEASTSNHE